MTLAEQVAAEVARANGEYGYARFEAALDGNDVLLITTSEFGGNVLYRERFNLPHEWSRLAMALAGGRRYQSHQRKAIAARIASNARKG